MISGWFLGGKEGSEGFGVLRGAGEGCGVFGKFPLKMRHPYTFVRY